MNVERGEEDTGLSQGILEGRPGLPHLIIKIESHVGASRFLEVHGEDTCDMLRFRTGEAARQETVKTAEPLR